MIKISRNISQVVECPFLPTNITYYACLWCEDKPLSSEPQAIGVVDEDTQVTTFTFSKEDINKYEDGDKLSLTIWNAEHSQDWRERNLFKVVESHVKEE